MELQCAAYFRSFGCFLSIFTQNRCIWGDLAEKGGHFMCTGRGEFVPKTYIDIDMYQWLLTVTPAGTNTHMRTLENAMTGSGHLSLSFWRSRGQDVSVKSVGVPGFVCLADEMKWRNVIVHWSYHLSLVLRFLPRHDHFLQRKIRRQLALVPHIHTSAATSNQSGKVRTAKTRNVPKITGRLRERS